MVAVARRYDFPRTKKSGRVPALFGSDLSACTVVSACLSVDALVYEAAMFPSRYDMFDINSFTDIARRIIPKNFFIK